jgi:hypothetical protein
LPVAAKHFGAMIRNSQFFIVNYPAKGKGNILQDNEELNI